MGAIPTWRRAAAFPDTDVPLASRSSDIRDAVDLIRRAVSGVQSQRAHQLSALADQLERHFNELHLTAIHTWAPELVAER